MSLSSSPLQDTICETSMKGLIAEAATFISNVLPPILCYFAMAALAITPRTHTVRIALFPVVAVLALRAAVPMDMSLKITERKLHHRLAPWLFLITARALSWALARKPLVRQLRPVNNTPSTLMDALDLVSNLRGYGWDWSRGVRISRETRPSNRTRFIFYTILSAAAHVFVMGILHTAIRSFSFPELGTLSSGPISDVSLPFHLRFLRTTVISALTIMWLYAGFQACYDLCTLLGVLVLRQDPAQWPPFFDAPWRATSLTDFWGRRWHQLLRRTSLLFGGYPLSFILGRAGIVIGVFFVTTVYQHLHFTALTGGQSEFWRMLVGFWMMAPGIIIEDIFGSVTGGKVQGPAGWIWTMSWILLWGNAINDAFTTARFFRFLTPIDRVLPVRMLVEYLVTEFDKLLHATSSVQVG